MVRLKARYSVVHLLLELRFNSEMVRLKAGQPDGLISLKKSFNSEMVRLKEAQAAAVYRLSGVSIPKWFD